MTKSFKRILTLTGRNIKEILRDPLSLIFMFAMPFVMQIMFYFLFHNATSQFDMIYLTPGIIAFSQTFLTLFAGILISNDRNSSFLTRLYVSKAKSHEFILGYTCALLPIAAVQTILFIIVGGIIDTSIFSINILPCLLMSTILSLFFIGFGLLFGSICNEKAIGGISSIVICGQSILSGMWFPIEGLNDGFIKFMNVLPFRNISKILQNILLYNRSFINSILIPFIIVAAYTITIFILAILIYNKKMKNR